MLRCGGVGGTHTPVSGHACAGWSRRPDHRRRRRPWRGPRRDSLRRSAVDGPTDGHCRTAVPDLQHLCDETRTAPTVHDAEPLYLGANPLRLGPWLGVYLAVAVTGARWAWQRYPCRGEGAGRRIEKSPPHRTCGRLSLGLADEPATSSRDAARSDRRCYRRRVHS